MLARTSRVGLKKVLGTDWWCSDEQLKRAGLEVRVTMARCAVQDSPQCLSQMTASSNSMSVPDDYLKLVPALRPYFHQITGVVWAASWRRDVRKRIFHDSLSTI